MESAAKLGAAGQMTLAVSYAAVAVFGLLAMGGGDIGALVGLAGLGLLVGMILTGIAWLRATEAFGGLATAAGWLLLSSWGLALIVFIAVPGGREWGKLGAIIYAAGSVGIMSCASGLVAGIALLKAAPASSRRLFVAAAVGHIGSAVCGLSATTAQLAGASPVLTGVVGGLGLVLVLLAHFAGYYVFRSLAPTPRPAEAAA